MMPAPPLRRQNDCLRFIQRTMDERGLAPSYDEIGAALGLASKSGVHRLVTGLEDRGAIRRIPGKPRAMEILNGEGTDTLAFLQPDVRERVRNLAKRRGVQPESIVAEICRAHFGGSPT